MAAESSRLMIGWVAVGVRGTQALTGDRMERSDRRRKRAAMVDSLDIVMRLDSV